MIRNRQSVAYKDHTRPLNRRYIHTEFIHSMPVLLVKGELHKDTDCRANLVFHWRGHYNR